PPCGDESSISGLPVDVSDKLAKAQRQGCPPASFDSDRRLPKLGRARLPAPFGRGQILGTLAARRHANFNHFPKPLSDRGFFPFSAKCGGHRCRWTGSGRLPRVRRPLARRGSMRLSEYFLPLLREKPSEAQLVPHS